MFASLVALFALAPGNVEKDLVFRKVGDTELKYDLYMPAGQTRDIPFVIVIHGGGWIDGDKTQLAQVCTALQQRGFASAAISYRLSPTHRWPAHLDDVQSAVRYFRANGSKKGLRVDKIGAIGASVGGHLSLLLGSMETRDTKTDFYKDTSSRVQAVVNLFGPTDMTKDFNQIVASVLSIQVLGKRYDQATEELKSFSPVNHITDRSAPTVTIHGDADTLVPVQQAKRLDEAFKKVKVDHKMFLVPGMGHTVDPTQPECAKGMEAGFALLEKELKR